MATVKKAVKKAIAKKVMSKRPMMQAPPSASSPMGGGPMMKAGGKIKKAADGIKATKKELYPAPKKQTGMDALKSIGKYVSTFGGATEKDDPKQKDINIVKKIKETVASAKSSLGLKSGGKMRSGGVLSPSKNAVSKNVGNLNKAKAGAKMKMGGKCKNGC
jgi:hypothetical protein